MIGGGLLLTSFEEKLKPYISSTYFAPFVGEEIKRSNLNTMGINLDVVYWFSPNTKLSWMLEGSFIWIAYPKVPDNPLINKLALQYIPGAGSYIGDNENTLVLAFHIGAKIVYRISGS